MGDDGMAAPQTRIPTISINDEPLSVRRPVTFTDQDEERDDLIHNENNHDRPGGILHNSSTEPPTTNETEPNKEPSAPETKTYTWDVFTQNTYDGNEEAREECIYRATQVFKVIAIIFFFLFILVGVTVNKAILLFVTSQIQHAPSLTCWTYNLTVPDPSPNISAIIVVDTSTQCTAVSKNYVFRYGEDELNCIKEPPGWMRVEEFEDVELCPILAVRWVWCLVLMMCFSYICTVARNVWLICLKHEPSPRRDVFFVSLFTDSLYTVGICLLVFKVIPNLYNVLQGAALLNGLSTIPAVLLLFNFPGQSCRGVFTVIFDVLSVLCQLSACVLWPVMSWYRHPDLPFYWEVPVALIFVSAGWWENYAKSEWGDGFSEQQAEFYKQFSSQKPVTFMESMRAAKVKLSLLGNIWKIVLTLMIAFLIHPAYGSDGQWYSFFNVDTETCSDFGNGVPEDMLAPMAYDWIVMLAVQLTIGLIVYFIVRAAAKTQIQPATVGAALLLTTPATLGALIGMCNAWEDTPCTFSGIVPEYAFWACDKTRDYTTFFVDDYGWLVILWWLSQLWVSRHIWMPSAERLAKSKNLFVQPLIDLVVLDPWILHNRRRNDESGKTGSSLPQRSLSRRDTRSGTISEAPEYQRGQSVVSVDRDEPDPTGRVVPKIYMCATMWHETRQEIIQILKSIFRSDIDQCQRRLLEEVFDMEDPDYYEFEAHIFFDDAMTAHSEGEHDYKVNDFVAMLVECINEAASAVRDEPLVIPDPVKIPTPYGGRLTWKMPGGNVLVAHLKDKEKIRHKKRWSQVMYMYYLLGLGVWDRVRNWKGDDNAERAQKIADRTFVLALDGDVDFRPKAVRMLVDLMLKDEKVGAACGRIHPIGTGPMVWYQKFEYALGHWMQKATEHVLGCVLCSPGCFSLFRGSALMDENVMRTYTTLPTEAVHHVQYDQGEDRWLCTLLLQQGHRVEYSAASDAYTFAPEGFYEFFNQRRRWMPSTMANIMDLLVTWRQVIENNENISMLYIIYQTVLLVSSVLGTGTIFLMIVGAVEVALAGAVTANDAFLLNMVPVIIYLFICYMCKSQIQLFAAAILTVIYALLQMLVLVGVIIQIAEDGPCSPNALFFFFVAGTFILAALLHPQEAMCVCHGFIYFLAIPSMYMLLMMYAMTNMHVISWGTREVTQTKTEKQLEEERKALEEQKKAKSKGNSWMRLGQAVKNEEGFTLSIGDLWRCTCCPRKSESQETKQFKALMMKMERMEEHFTDVNEKLDSLSYDKENRPSPEDTDEQEAPGVYAGHENWELGPSPRMGRRISFAPDIAVAMMNGDRGNPLYQGESESEEEPEEEPEVRDELKNPKWIEDERLGGGNIEFLDEKEEKFFIELIEKYLYPILKDKVKEEKTQMALIELRNKMSGTYFLMNAIFVVVIFTLQANVDKVHMAWPCGDNLILEPIGFTFLCFFGLIMVLQIVGMIIHRATTFFHIISTTKLPCEQGIDNGSEELQRHIKFIMNQLSEEAR